MSKPRVDNEDEGAEVGRDPEHTPLLSEDEDEEEERVRSLSVAHLNGEQINSEDHQLLSDYHARKAGPRKGPYDFMDED